MRLMRDRVLCCTPQGDAYVKVFEAASPELVEVFVAYPDILKKADEVIESPICHHRISQLGRRFYRTSDQVRNVVKAVVPSLVSWPDLPTTAPIS
jgi:hypothetical protein